MAAALGRCLLAAVMGHGTSYKDEPVVTTRDPAVDRVRGAELE
jgi:hypothetical protein